MIGTERVGLPLHKRLAGYISESSFTVPDYLDPTSAWIEHGPFASWLVTTTKPASIVELGTHGGYSYFVLCQAVESAGLPTRCFAVDHWEGDDHAGFYGGEVYQRVKEHNDSHYATFSRLIRATFDDALDAVDDCSVDLLHIDGRHAYEDVKHDFESWIPKMSDRGVVIMHDIAVLDRGFGVHKFVAELREIYPIFEFAHGHGLGVVAVGASVPEEIAALCSTERDSALADDVRSAYSRLGLSLSAPLELRDAVEAARAAGQAAAQAAAEAAEIAAEEEKRAIFSSTSWRVTAPLRLVSQILRPSARKRES